MYRREDASFPERIFAPIGQRGRVSLGATIQIIGQSCKQLQVSKYQLAGLLDCNPDRVHRWLRGERSPSAYYLARLTQLWLLQWVGLPVYLMRKMMWEQFSSFYLEFLGTIAGGI
jgi:transcriptional regulator with XRE-family HTH domain